MWLYDAQRLNFLEVNEAAIHHYGYSRDEFLDRLVTDVHPHDEAERLLDRARHLGPGHAAVGGVAPPAQGRPHASTWK